MRFAADSIFPGDPASACPSALPRDLLPHGYETLQFLNGRIDLANQTADLGFLTGCESGHGLFLRSKYPPPAGPKRRTRIAFAIRLPPRSGTDNHTLFNSLTSSHLRRPGFPISPLSCRIRKTATPQSPTSRLDGPPGSRGAPGQTVAVEITLKLRYDAGSRDRGPARSPLDA